MIFTDDNFEALKNRYIQKLRYTRNKFMRESRNTETSAQAFGLGFLFTTSLPMDEFSQKITESFDWTYDIGQPIDVIVNGLIDEVRVNYLKDEAQRPEERIVIVKRKLWKIKLPLAKYYETYAYNGELTSRFKLKINWSRETFKRLKEANSEEEKDFIIFNMFVKKVYLFQKPNEMTTSIINPEETDKNKWFKALVKYRANKEFMPELYISELPPQEQKAAEQTKEKRKKETVKLVKWTDGKTKNNFTKLVYALHRAQFLEDGKGEVTKMVDNLAPVFGLEMGDWESNLSSGITGPSKGYDHGAFFDKLKKSYLEIVEERLETQEIKKTVKIEKRKKDAADNFQ